MAALNVCDMLKIVIKLFSDSCSFFFLNLSFFVVEDHILHTTQGLVNRAYIDELWEMALSKTIAALRTRSSYCSDPNLMLDFKNLTMLFVDTSGVWFSCKSVF